MDTAGVAMGWDGRLILSAGDGSQAVLCYRKIDGDAPDSPISTACSESGGFVQETHSLKQWKTTVEAQWKPDNNPFTGPPLLLEKGFIDNVYVIPYFDKSGVILPENGYVYMPLARYSNVKFSSEAEGATTFTFELASYGAYNFFSRKVSGIVEVAPTL